MNHPKWTRILFPAIFAALAPLVHADQLDIRGPAGSGAFGTHVTRLANGNFVVTDPYYDAPGPIRDVGAVYLYNGKTLKLISRLTGGRANDRVGMFVTPLKNGNYVVTSPHWANGAATEAGAATWCNGTAGINGLVSPANSLVGSAKGDRVGLLFVGLLDGSDHYLVHSPYWNDAAGALTWGNGNAGAKGAVSSSNSLIGSRAGDMVGMISVPLKSGNYVAVSGSWSNGSISQAGAVTWCDGKTGRTGVISQTNSLVGNQPGNGYFFQVTALTNGNCVVSNPAWSNGSLQRAGAVRWCPGNSATTGIFSGSGALVGDRAGGGVGSRVTALTNGNYVVESWFWPNDNGLHYGAVTHCNGAAGRAGTVAESNSLTGLGKGSSGHCSITALTNGNYVVNAFGWLNDANNLAGAVTWCNGVSGRTGKVTAQNSLVGSHPVGLAGGSVSTVALKNGNYVVASPRWSNGGAAAAGAVTWGNGATGATGTVSTSNSLVGSRAGDMVGSGYITALENGNYVVGSPEWARGSAKRAGAATWCKGTTGRTGAVSPLNSLVGSTADDQVGRVIIPLKNGSYVVGSPDWDDGTLADTGAATWGNGNSGITGETSRNNSLIGSRAGDRVGTGGFGFWGGAMEDYLVHSRDWRNGSLPKAGAVTWCDGAKGTRGLVTGSNSVLGGVAQAGNDLRINLWPARDLLLVGQPAANLVSVFQRAGSPSQPEIDVRQPANKALTDGKSKIAFGTAVAGSGKGIARTFTIRNTGGKPLTGIKVSKSGRHAGDFRIKGRPATSLAPGRQTTFKVTFMPKAKGLRTAWLRVASNDADENPFDIPVTGRAVRK